MTRQNVVVATFLFSMLAGCSRERRELAESPPVEVGVANPVVEEITYYDNYTGEVSDDSKVKVDLFAQVTGLVTEIKFTDGQIVQKGQELIQIDPRQYQAQVDQQLATIAAADARLRVTQRDFERTAELVKTNAASQEDYDKDLATRDESAAELQRAKADLEQKKLYLEWCTITAPFEGRMSNSLVNIGTLVNGAPGSTTQLTTIVQIDPAYVWFYVDERSMQFYMDEVQRREGKRPTVGEIKAAKIPVRVALASELGFPHEGIIDFVDTATNEQTGTINVRGVFDNADRVFIPGYFARVQIRHGPPHKGMLVSERAISSQLDQKYVYVVDAEGKVARKDIVTVDISYQGMREVTKGLAETDRVIVDNIQRLRPGDSVVAKEAPMPRLAAAPPAEKPQADSTDQDNPGEE